MTSRDHERGGPGMGQTSSNARRITLLCWLLVLTLTASAECAWVLWLQDHLTADARTVASPPHLRVAPREGITNELSP